jgi:hypothetical protein
VDAETSGRWSTASSPGQARSMCRPTCRTCLRYCPRCMTWDTKVPRRHCTGCAVTSMCREHGLRYKSMSAHVSCASEIKSNSYTPSTYCNLSTCPASCGLISHGLHGRLFEDQWQVRHFYGCRSVLEVCTLRAHWSPIHGDLGSQSVLRLGDPAARNSGIDCE